MEANSWDVRVSVKLFIFPQRTASPLSLRLCTSPLTSPHTPSLRQTYHIVYGEPCFFPRPLTWLSMLLANDSQLSTIPDRRRGRPRLGATHGLSSSSTNFTVCLPCITSLSLAPRPTNSSRELVRAGRQHCFLPFPFPLHVFRSTSWVVYDHHSVNFHDFPFFFTQPSRRRAHHPAR